MLVVLSVSHKDDQQAINLLKWIAELGSVANHEIMLAFSLRIQGTGQMQECIDIATSCFSKVYAYSLFDEDERGWPWSPNHAWLQICEYIAHPRTLPAPQPFFWMEADATPTRATWGDEIDADYKIALANKKPFMGGDVRLKEVCRHMTGIAVYPPNVGAYTDKLGKLSNEAWDTFIADDVLPYAHFTTLIQHEFWWNQEPNMPPRMPSFQSDEDMAKIKPETAIYHRCKDGSLIDRLREKRAGKAITIPQTDDSILFRSMEIVSNAMRLGTPEKRIIHTYCATVLEIDPRDEIALADEWGFAWRAAGWEPSRIGESEAIQHPLYAEAKRIFESFPTTNPKQYEVACFMRWLAMAQIGGGWMADYDVFPLTGNLWQPNTLAFFSGNERDPLIPCLVWGTADDYLNMVKFFMRQKPTGHFSDMVALRTLDRGKYFSRDVKEWGEDGWQDGPAVHFPTARMKPAGKMPKWKFITEILESLKPKEQPKQTKVEVNGHVLPIKDLIAQLGEHAKKDNFARGRIKKQLKAAGFAIKS